MSFAQQKTPGGYEGAKAPGKSRVTTVISFLAFLLIRFIGRTTRLRIIGEDKVKRSREKKGNVIYAFWHNRILLLIYAHRNQKVSAMVSRSRDGESISNTLRRFGVDSVRGSSSRGGSSALRALSKKLEDGFDVAVAPDGPQGPRYRAQSGAVHLALTSGRSIVPVSSSTSRKWTLKSWDRFLIPCPFAKALLIYGDPVEVEKNSNLEDKRLELEQKLTELTNKADSYWKHKIIPLRRLV